jgi:hypothetical protein
MTEVPKIVHQRLRAAELGAQAQTHPEADALAAFAEQALPAAERENVLAHLSLCADCRDVVLLALPATEAAAIATAPETEAVGVAPDAQPTRPNWFTDLFTSNFRFANLRWAALAAGVALALFVVHAGLEHSGKSDQRAGVSQKAAPTEPAAQVASEALPQSSSGDLQKPAEIKPQLPSARVRPTPAFKPNPAAKAPPSAATALKASTNAGQLAASPPVDITSSTPTLLAENHAPSVEKAKPPLSEAANDTNSVDAATQTPTVFEGSTAPAAQTTSAPISLKQGMLWRLQAGVLQRSLDGGQTWLPILQGEHPWLCYAARGRELWAGGPAGALQHSADNGASWSVVVVSAQGQSLGGDVIQIEVSPASQIVITTATGETWTSSDGGKSWEKK